MAKRLNHRPLLGVPKVRSWYDSNTLGSKQTAEVNLRRLGLFCAWAKLTPLELAEMAQGHPTDLKDLLVRFARIQTERGRVGAYVKKLFVGVQSWLRFNEIRFEGIPKVKVFDAASLSNERVPTPEELARIVAGYGPRGRVTALMMAHAGVRPGVLATVDASEGLRLSDLKDLALEPELKFERIPFHVLVPARLSKTSAEYHTFGTDELADAILGYLLQRRQRGEKLTASSPLITADPMGEGTKMRRDSGHTDFITTAAMMRELRDGLKAVLDARTCIFRSYCSTQLWMAANQGLLTRDAYEAMLGHSLGVGGRYNLKKKLHAQVVEELREGYERASQHLVARRAGGLLSDEKVLEAVLVKLGVDQAKIDDAKPLTREKMVELLGATGRNSTEEVVSAERFKQLLAAHVRLEEKLPLADGEVYVKYSRVREESTPGPATSERIDEAPTTIARPAERSNLIR